MQTALLKTILKPLSMKGEPSVQSVMKQYVRKTSLIRPKVIASLAIHTPLGQLVKKKKKERRPSIMIHCLTVVLAVMKGIGLSLSITVPLTVRCVILFPIGTTSRRD